MEILSLTKNKIMKFIKKMDTSGAIFVKQNKPVLERKVSVLSYMWNIDLDCYECVFVCMCIHACISIYL